MAFFETLGTLKEKTKDLASAGKQKSKEFMEIAKLNMANASEEEGIRKAYSEIGKLYYAERGMAPDAPYAALCERITSAKSLIAENKERINAIKEAEGDDVQWPDDPVESDVPPEEPSCEANGDACDCGCGEQPKAEAAEQEPKTPEE